MAGEQHILETDKLREGIPKINAAIDNAAAAKTLSEANANQIEMLLGVVYVPPAVTISTNPNVSVKEYGDNIDVIVLTAATTKKVYPIEKVEFYRDSVLINTISAPNPDGGNETYTDSTAISDTVTFTAKVYDEQSSSQSVKTINYVYPFYVGSVANSSPTEAQIKALSKLVKTKGDTAYSFTLTDSRFVIAYPKSYGTLSSILDKNGFETINSYTRTEVTITGLNGVAVVYYVYTLNNITTQTNFTNTFKF